jgi:hypothetical protein
LFERSELFEAPAELIERSEKKNSERASEVGGRSPSRSKRERIKIIMGGAQSDVEEDKKGTGGLKGVGEGEYSKTILLFFAPARGLLGISFFY